MKQIPLTNGGFSQVDNRIYDFLMNWKWTKDKSRNNYVICTAGLKERRLHRLIMLAKKGEEIDHIDGNPLNNLVSNLRVCKQRENKRNRKINNDNKSGYKGVSWHKPTNKWLCHIRHNNKIHHLGVFTNKEEAAKKYNQFARLYHGKFARLNILKGGEELEEQTK